MIKLRTWLELVAIPKNSFYEWKAKLSQPEEDMEENTLIEAIKAIIESSNQSYGYRRVTLALNQRGRKINHKRVLRIMRENQLLCVKFRRKSRRYSSFKGEVGTIADNHLDRQFVTKESNQVWVIDVTEFKVAHSESKMYLSLIMDL